MDQPLTKKLLIDTMRVERARWEMLLLRVGPRRMSVPVEGTGRTIAEIVGALHERERWLVERLASVQALPSPFAESQSRGPGPNQHTPLIDASREAFNEVLRLLVPISEPDLFGTCRFQWSQGRTLAEVVFACTISYYIEHDPPIRSWLSQSVVQAV